MKNTSEVPRPQSKTLREWGSARFLVSCVARDMKDAGRMVLYEPETMSTLIRGRELPEGVSANSIQIILNGSPLAMRIVVARRLIALAEFNQMPLNEFIAQSLTFAVTEGGTHKECIDDDQFRNYVPDDWFDRYHGLRTKKDYVLFMEECRAGKIL